MTYSFFESGKKPAPSLGNYIPTPANPGTNATRTKFVMPSLPMPKSSGGGSKKSQHATGEFHMPDISKYIATSHAVAFSDYINFMSSHAPNFANTLNATRPADLLDFLPKQPNQPAGGFFKNWQNPNNQIEVLAEQFRGSKASYVKPQGGGQQKSLFPVDNWIHDLFGGDNTPSTIHLDHPEATKVMKDAMHSLTAAGLSQTEALHSLTENINPKTKKIDLKKIFKESTYAKTAALKTKELKQQQKNSPGAEIDQFIKGNLTADETNYINNKISLLDQYTGYYNRKQAGLTGKKLGKDPLTGFSRKYLGIPTGVPITPDLLQQSIAKSQNNMALDEFNTLHDKFKEIGIYNQIQKIIQLRIQKTKGLPKAPNTSLQGLFNEGQADLKMILNAYVAYTEDPNILAKIVPANSASAASSKPLTAKDLQ